MKRSGSAVRIRLCAGLLLALCLIGGIVLLFTGVHAVTEGNMLEQAVGQNQIIYGIICILGGVILRELMNGFSIIVATHEGVEQKEAPPAPTPVRPAPREEKQKNWICTQCHTENAPSRDTCEGCGTKRSGLPASRKNATVQAARQQLSLWEQMLTQKTTWTCPACGKENKLSVGSCEGCGTDKPRQC